MKRHDLITMLLLLIITSCENTPCNCEMNESVIHKNDSIITNVIQKYGDRQREYWQRFDEQALSNNDVESYRFSITVLLADYQKIYRIDRKGDEAKLYIKEYAVPTTTEFREDSLVRDTIRLLTSLEWNNLKRVLGENCFWTIPVDVEKRVLDGSSWTLEGFNPDGNNCTDSKYHYAYRASPDSSRFRNISTQIMALDSFKLKEF